MSTHRVQSRISRISVRGKRFAVVASRFNPSLTRNLVQGALRVLHRAGVLPGAIHVAWVSGAFELPVMAARLAKRQPRPHAIIALGALVKGATVQYEVIASAVAHGLMNVSVSSGIPVSFGVIVAETAAQAKARAGGQMGNRGSEAAQAVLSVLEASSGIA